LESDAVRAWPVEVAVRPGGQGVEIIGRNAMKTCETWNTDGSL